MTTENEFKKALNLKNKIDIACKEEEKLLNYVYNKKNTYEDDWYPFTTEEGNVIMLRLSVITTAMEKYLKDLQSEYNKCFEKKVGKDKC